MSHRDNILDAIRQEITVCTQLFKKLPDGALAFKPAENMRTTEELLRYIATCAASSLKFYTLEQNRDTMRANYKVYDDKSDAFDITAFPEIMDEQIAEIEELFKSFPDAALLENRVMMPWGEEMALGRAILEGPLKWLAAYKMQLFLYAKLAGNPDLNTRDCWVGR